MKGRIIFRGSGTVYVVEGKEVTEAEFYRVFPPQKLDGVPGGPSPGCWPLHSDALAVHPDQVEEARGDAAAKGVPTDFDRHGRPILLSRQHRKEYLKAYRFRDNNGGYGD